MQQRNYVAYFAIALWGLTGAAALVHAQQTPDPPAAAKPEAVMATPLTDDALKQMLTTMGYKPKALSKGYQITIKQNKWTFNIQAVLSDNGEKMGLNTIAGDVKKPDDVPAKSWLALLETNPDIDPTTFYFDKQQNRLCLHRACDNRGITANVLRKEIDAFMFDVVGTSNLWQFTQ